MYLVLKWFCYVIMQMFYLVCNILCFTLRFLFNICHFYSIFPSIQQGVLQYLESQKQEKN